MEPRLYVEGQWRAGETIDLPEGATRHAQVLRLRPGDALALFNGAGGEFAGTVFSVSRSKIQVRIDCWKNIERESPLAITLAQGISSGEKMDFTVQKAVELGVAVIQPLLCEKSVVRLDAKRAAAKAVHWRRIAIAACEQCGRNRIPEIFEPLEVGRYRPGKDSMCLLLSPSDGKSFKDVLETTKGPVCIVAGPEAGLSESEIAILKTRGFASVSLGPRVLRTETAALAALAALNALRGDFSPAARRSAGCPSGVQCRARCAPRRRAPRD